MKKLLVVGIIGLSLAAGSAFAAAGRSATEAVVKCRTALTEDAAANPKLVEFDRQSDGSLKIVYRCSTP